VLGVLDRDVVRKRVSAGNIWSWLHEGENIGERIHEALSPFTAAYSIPAPDPSVLKLRSRETIKPIIWTLSIDRLPGQNHLLD
jgi:hypothetical protein